MQLKPKPFGDPIRYLWTDLPGADAAVREQVRLSPPELLGAFIRDGVAIIREAVPTDAIDRFQSDVYSSLSKPDHALMMTFWDSKGKNHVPARREFLGEAEAKLLDVHSHVPLSRDLLFSQPILNFLHNIFQDEPVAHQTLYFEYGSGQGAHNDTAFVVVDPPNRMVASWIALEDVSPDTGELFYYPGSHRIGDQIFSNGGKMFDGADPDAPRYSAALEELMAANGLRRERFHPRRGDVLFWSADLVHGGEPIRNRQTRRSLVTHYSPVGTTIPYAKNLGRAPERVPGGGYIVSGT